MKKEQLRDVLARVPEVTVTEDLSEGLAESVAYLGSDAAQRSLETDVYWPKWNSPWWHMLCLWELGEARRIPSRAVTAMVSGMKAFPLKFFPLRPEEAPGADFKRDVMCHCGLGSIDQVLAACGVDVDAELPWVIPWYARYQMSDGGLTCDNEAYLVEGECPSSMVGTIAPFEAAMRAEGRAGGEVGEVWREFVDRAADFLIGRELRLGSSSVHNAEERGREQEWLLPCFPRFYFYDVLRGLAALVTWAASPSSNGRDVPLRAVAPVAAHLATRYPDGAITLGREGFASCPTTLAQTPAGTWEREPTSHFPLLAAASALGRPSAVLTRQWTDTRLALLRLLDAHRVIE